MHGPRGDGAGEGSPSPVDRQAKVRLSEPTAILDSNGQKARYGVSYLRNVCAQAGVGLWETPLDEDVLAIDCNVEFREAPVRVQVKCTSSVGIGERSAIRWALKEQWVQKWHDSLIPIYFLVVIVPEDIAAWLKHRADGTFHKTAGYWRRIYPNQLTTAISVPTDQRFTVDTVTVWHSDLIAVFSPEGGP